MYRQYSASFDAKVRDDFPGVVRCLALMSACTEAASLTDGEWKVTAAHYDYQNCAGVVKKSEASGLYYRRRQLLATVVPS